jgi:hypothetical protein
MYNAEMVIFIMLSMTALSMTAVLILNHSELIDTQHLSHYQLVYSQEAPISSSLIHKSNIPSGTNIGLIQGDSNITSMDSKLHIENRSNAIVELIADLVENNLKQAANTLLITSLDPRAEAAQYASNISESYMGIPEDLDSGKRDIAKQILSLNKDFGSVYFLIPNGDVYLGEPYAGQEQLPRLNYADRDWYKGIFAITNNISREHKVPVPSLGSSSNNASEAILPVIPYYISAVFQSAAIHVPATGIAVPVYDKNTIGTMELSGDYESALNSSTLESSVDTTTDGLSGYWVGVLNMNETRNYVDQLDLMNQNLRAVVVDHNGTAIIDTLENITPQSAGFDLLNVNSSSQTNLIDLQSVKLGLNGESGSIVENINGTSARISFHPIDASPHTWTAILIDSNSNNP